MVRNPRCPIIGACMSCEIQVVARFIVTWVAPVVSPISVMRRGVSESILETPFFIGKKGGKNRVKVRNIIIILPTNETPFAL